MGWRLTTLIVKALSTLSQKVPLSPKTAIVAENGETTARVAEFGDSRTFLRQSPFSATAAEIGDYTRQCGQALSRRRRVVHASQLKPCTAQNASFVVVARLSVEDA